MKKVILLVVIAISTLLSFESFAVTSGTCIPTSRISIVRDPGDAFPWGCELPFPWRQIQGTWQTDVDGVKTYFSFRTIKTSPEGNQLQIIQYDPTTCVAISTGSGFEGIRVVSAFMTDNTSQNFNVTVHVFNRADVRTCDKARPEASETVTVITMSPLGSMDGINSYELEKISQDPKGFCL